MRLILQKCLQCLRQVLQEGLDKGTILSREHFDYSVYDVLNRIDLEDVYTRIDDAAESRGGEWEES
jgi:hypothetical protein